MEPVVEVLCRSQPKLRQGPRNGLSIEFIDGDGVVIHDTGWRLPVEGYDDSRRPHSDDFVVPILIQDRQAEHLFLEFDRTWQICDLNADVVDPR